MVVDRFVCGRVRAFCCFVSDGWVAYSMVVDRFAGGRLSIFCFFGSDGRMARAMEVENLDGVWCASVFGTTGWRVTLETINPFNPGMDRDRRGMQYGS